ncbi:MAG: YibE/F family protein [Actinomycetia bacterium]|nr:YibE/F family protein [Actinomycetes bacterium]
MGAPVTPDRTTIRKVVTWSVAAAAVLAFVGIIAFWPTGEAPSLGFPQDDYFDATVTKISVDECQSLEIVSAVDCSIATFELTSGPDAGATGQFVVAADDLDLPSVAEGDAVIVLDVPTSPEPYRYVFVDFQRTSSLWVLAILFVVVVVAFGRWHGVRALLGLAAGGLILIAFVVPSLLRDNPAVWVALAGTVAIAVLALYLAHGFDFSTTVALAGTLVALLVTTLLALVASSFANLTGLGDEDAQVLRITADALDLRGLLVAGIVVGALGVIDDVTVTQVSTVAALRRADPTMGPWALYSEAVRVGRDHIASTVNTLVLAYAGAALPLVLLFAQGSAPVARILTGEVVAVEIIRMLVGSIGLVLSVPITTALAAATLEPSDVGHHDHGGHVHGAPASHVTVPADSSKPESGETTPPGGNGPKAATPPDADDAAWEEFSGDDRDFWDG